MPPVISAIVNTLVINKRLNRTALSLIRSEQRAEGYRQFDIKSNNFERVFRIRHMVRELRCSVAVVLGMLISMLVIVLGFNTYSLCTDVRDRNVADTKYEYMYLYKYPEKEAPAGSEAAYVEVLNTDVMGYTLEVSVIGIEGESRYFDARPEKDKSKAVMDTSYQWYAYILLYCVMMLVYLVINKLLVRKISKITPAEVLKNRE